MDFEWTSNGLRVDSKWTLNELQVDFKWTLSEHQVDIWWTQRGLQVDSKRTPIYRLVAKNNLMDWEYFSWILSTFEIQRVML